VGFQFLILSLDHGSKLMSSCHFLGQILHFESGWVFGSGSVIGVNCLARLFVYNVTARSFMLSSYRKGKLHRKKRLVHLS